MYLFRPTTGFQLWLEENRKIIVADQPDLEETDIIKEAMGRFRTLSADERLVGTLKDVSNSCTTSLLSKIDWILATTVVTFLPSEGIDSVFRRSLLTVQKLFSVPLVFICFGLKSKFTSRAHQLKSVKQMWLLAADPSVLSVIQRHSVRLHSALWVLFSQMSTYISPLYSQLKTPKEISCFSKANLCINTEQRKDIK